MAQPITNLSYVWSAGVGIQISWTAATDATTGSIYQISYLNNSSQFVVTGNVYPSASRPTSSSSYVLNDPGTQFLFSWQTMLSLTADKTAPNAVTLQIVHIDSSGNYSSPVSILALAPQTYEYQGIPHLDNNLVVNPVTGQFSTTSQNSFSEISNSVQIVTGTIPGQRSLVSEFGIQDLPINQIDINEMTQIINSWEPRSQAKLSLSYDDNNNAQINVNITSASGD